MRDNKLTNILLIILLLFNVTFVSTWWFHRIKWHHKIHDVCNKTDYPDRKGTAFLINQLNFDANQQVKLETVHKIHMQKLDMFHAAIARNEKGITKVLMVTPADSIHANICSDSIGIIRTEMSKEFFKYLQSIKQLCTPEQSGKFEMLMNDMSKFFYKDMHHSNSESKHDSM